MAAEMDCSGPNEVTQVLLDADNTRDPRTVPHEATGEIARKGQKVKLRTLLRIVTSVLLFTNIILEFFAIPNEPVAIVLIVITWLLFTLNISSFAPRSLSNGCKRVLRGLPQISFVIDGREVVLSGRNDGGEDGTKHVVPVAFFFDVILTALVFFLTVIPHAHRIWWEGDLGVAISIIHCIVVPLEVVISAFLVVPVLDDLHFLVRPSTHGRIRLPDDLEASTTANVSTKGS